MLLDIAFGVLGAVVFAKTQGVPLAGFLLAAHIAFALLPDADFLYQALRRRSLSGVESSHRYVLHAPLFYIPLGVLVSLVVAPEYAWSFAALSLAHFLHDSVGIGWGVRWLYPFSRRAYKLFSSHDGRISGNLMTSWSPEEEAQLEVRTNPDKDWFKRVYLRPNPISITEHAATLVVLAIAWLLL